jgi:hypothetical protein
LNLFLDNGQSALRIHRHALSQMCTRLRLPISYLEYLMTQEAWGWDLAAGNLQTLLQRNPFTKQNNRPRRFLLRSVDKTLRGFLTRSYGIHLSTNPLLLRFLDECTAKDAVPIEAGMSDVRFHVKCALPYVYEVFKGQYLALGLSFHNSDFGAGKFSIREAIWDPINGRGMIMGEPEASLIDRSLRDRVHLGPVLEDKDLNTSMGRRTEEASKHVKDTVQAMFSQSWIEELCFTIEKAQDMELPWSAIVKKTGAALLKEEVERLKKLLLEGDPSLPPLQRGPDVLPIPTMWWTASAISKMASEQTDEERKVDLQEQAGKFIHTQKE